MYRCRLPILVVAILTSALLAAPSATAVAAHRTGSPRTAATTPVNVDVSQRHLNESEEAIAVNPTNPDNIVTVTNIGHTEAGQAAGKISGLIVHGGHAPAGMPNRPCAAGPPRG